MGFIGYKNLQKIAESTAKKTATDIIKEEIPAISNKITTIAMPVLIEEFRSALKEKDKDIKDIKSGLNLMEGGNNDKPNS